MNKRVRLQKKEKNKRRGIFIQDISISRKKYVTLGSYVIPEAHLTIDFCFLQNSASLSKVYDFIKEVQELTDVKVIH